MAYCIWSSHILVNVAGNKGFEIVDMKLYVAKPLKMHSYDLQKYSTASSRNTFTKHLISPNNRDVFRKIYLCYSKLYY